MHESESDLPAFLLDEVRFDHRRAPHHGGVNDLSDSTPDPEPRSIDRDFEHLDGDFPRR